MTQIWSNGQWMDAMDLPIACSDRGLTVGFGIFETLLAVDGEVVLLDRHMTRFRESCKRLGWGVVLPDMDSIMKELLIRNELTKGRSRVRMSLTGGSGWVNRVELGMDSVLWCQALAAGPVPEFSKVEISPYVRNERSAITGLKCLSYAENVLALDLAYKHGFDECLLMNTQGYVCEGGTSNVFLVKSGMVFTPSLASGCLPGVTRQIVLEICQNLEIPVMETDLRQEQLLDADEVFLTSSIRGVMAVRQIGDHVYRDFSISNILRSQWESGLKNGNFI